MGCILEREEANWNNYQSCTPNHWALWPMENLELYLMVILVATNGHQHRSFLQIVWKVSDQHNQHTETTGVSTQLANTRQAVAVSGHGLYGTIDPVTRKWLPVGNHWSTHIASTSSTNNNVSNSKRSTVGNKTIWMFGSFGLCIEYILWFNGWNSRNIPTYITPSQLYNKSRI